ncbi:MAG: cobalamin-dependent protein, partial [Proteobacteria bacterium]|nr:hypothetical protein [Desulfobacula sp.]MBU4131467.1 cobalamin-dependent protein [Pseudomonadota bacterium]
MRVHLVNAAVQYLLPRLEDFPCNVLPYGFCVVAATLKKHDINVDILDLNYYDGMAQIESVEEANLFLYNDVLSPSLERILVRITADIQNTVVGFSCLGFDALRRSLILAKYIKENNEKRINVFGGAAIHSNAQELMNDFPFVDYIIIKNGEHAFCELIHCLAQKRGITHIPNLAFRMDNRIIINPLSPYDLDDQTCPDYSFYETLDTDFFALEYMTSQG